VVRIQLHVAHLNRIPGDDRDENLQALCNWCHWNYDIPQHVASARITRQCVRTWGVRCSWWLLHDRPPAL
jgi:hypothetical protein